MRRAISEIRLRPFETAIIVVAPACGLFMMVLDTRPPSVTQTMPGLVQVGWEFGLLLAGVLGLLGIGWPGRSATRLGVELAAVLVLATVTGMYVVALAATTGARAVAAMSFIGAVTLGSIWRAVEILLVLRRLARAVPPVDRPSPVGWSV